MKRRVPARPRARTPRGVWAGAAAFALTIAVMAVGAVPAHASDDASPDPLAAIESAAPAVLDDVAAAPGSVGVDLPADPGDGITVRSATGVSVGIGLPNADDAATAKVEGAGVVSYDNGDGSTTVPVAKGNGGVQIATVIDGPQAPTRYEYPLDLPAGARIVLDPTTGAGAIFAADGTWITGVAPPWAKDADGRSVPTHFEVDGTTLVQIVEHSTAFAYPVVADPYLGAQWWGQWIKLNRAETKSLANRIAAGGWSSAAGVFCSYIPVKTGAVACGAAIAWRVNSWMAPVQQAASQGRCAQINIPYLSGPGLWNVTNERC